MFSYGTFAFHATCILYLSFLTIISFLTTTSLSTTALGPLLDAPDRCVGFLAWSYWEGDRTARQETAAFPPRCATTPFGGSPPTTLIQSSWSSKSLVKEGVTYCLCCMSYYCRSTASSTPYYFLKPWTIGQQKPFFGRFLILRPHCHFLWWEASSICAGAFFPSNTYDPSSPWNSSLMFLLRPEHHSYTNSHVV